MTSTGKVVFTDDLRDVRNVSDGGSLTVQRRRLSSSRRIELSASNGSVNRKSFVNDSEQPWNEESRRWFANELPFLVRRSSGASSLLFERWPRDPMTPSPPSRNAGRAIDSDEPTSRTSSILLRRKVGSMFTRVNSKCAHQVRPPLRPARG